MADVNVVATIPINNLTHPYYALRMQDWYKWRLTFEGGTLFKNEYLKRYERSETTDDFERRRLISYVPAFSKEAIIEIRDAIYQRFVDISRIGGSPSYQSAIIGQINGVDLLGSSMNVFMGTEVLEELLIMGRVGIYVDMQPKRGVTIAENQGIRPYVYIYRTEDIRSWDNDEGPTAHQFRSILLRDQIFVRDDWTDLPTGTTYRYRFYFRDENNNVWVKFFNEDNVQIDAEGNDTEDSFLLEGMDRIPFILLELNNSLLADIADCQISLLNLASADMNYCVGSNFPFYIEQFDPRYEMSHNKPPLVPTDEGGVSDNDVVTAPPNQTIELSSGSGRRYPKGTEPPKFIAPPSEPIKISMEKQEQIKKDIRLLVNLGLSNVQTKMASAESKGMDDRSLESGLSYIALIMEDAERQLATIWSEYENITSIPTIKYPDKYSLKSEQDIWAEIDELKKQMSAVPSITLQRAIAKRIAVLLIGTKVTSDVLKQIFKEIDKADVVSVLIDKIEKDVPLGILSKRDAAKLRGYPDDTVQQAQKEQADKIKLIQKSQSPGQGMGAADSNQNNNQLNNPAARGIPELSPNPKEEAAIEKEGKPTRGPESTTSND